MISSLIKITKTAVFLKGSKKSKAQSIISPVHLSPFYIVKASRVPVLMRLEIPPDDHHARFLSFLKKDVNHRHLLAVSYKILIFIFTLPHRMFPFFCYIVSYENIFCTVSISNKHCV